MQLVDAGAPVPGHNCLLPFSLGPDQKEVALPGQPKRGRELQQDLADFARLQRLQNVLDVGGKRWREEFILPGVETYEL